MVITAILTAISTSVVRGFLVTYMLIRTYAGGYHAKSQLGCYIFSTISITVILLAIKHITFSGFIYLLATLISTTVIYVFSPIENINKSLSQIEKELYGKKARSLVCIFTTVSLIMWFMEVSRKVEL